MSSQSATTASWSEKKCSFSARRGAGACFSLLWKVLGYRKKAWTECRGGQEGSGKKAISPDRERTKERHQLLSQDPDFCLLFLFPFTVYPPPHPRHPACFLRYVLTKSFWTWSCIVVLAQDQLTVKQFPSWLGKRMKQAHLHLQKTMLAQSHTLLVSAFAATSFQKQLLLSTFCAIAWQLEHSGK